MGTTGVLDERSEVLFLAAEMAAEQGVDLAAFLDANPGALDGLGADEDSPSDTSPIDLSGEDDLS